MRKIAVILVGLLALTPSAAFAVKVADITRISGQRTNFLTGLGLVVGLGGTGDGGDYAAAINPLREMLAKFADLAPEKATGLLRFATEGDFQTPTGPTCALKMIPRKSTTHGRKFWGCRNYPSCKQTFSNTL